MSPTFLLDENLRGKLWRAVLQHNLAGQNPIDAVRVGDSDAPRLGTKDPDIVQWAERSGRIVVSLDRNTLRPVFNEHLQTGSHSPGILIVQDGFTIARIVEHLSMITWASDAWEFQDCYDFIP